MDKEAEIGLDFIIDKLTKLKVLPKEQNKLKL